MFGLSGRSHNNGDYVVTCRLTVRSLSSRSAFRSSQATFNRVARLFLNQPCPLCDRPTPHTFCVDCDRQLRQSFQDLPEPGQPAQAHFVQNDPAPLSVTALGRYDGPLKRAILAMKYGDRPDIAYPLGTALAKRWQQQTIGQCHSVYAVPIPLHADRHQARGYNQAERIAVAFCRLSGLPLLSQGLQRTKVTQPQHRLSLDERQKNLAQVFQIGKTLARLANPANQLLSQSNPAILLIDDIYTTGATAQSAVTTLAQAGFPVVGIAVLAQARLT